MVLLIIIVIIIIFKATVTDLVCSSDGFHERKPRCEFFENLLFSSNFVQFIETDWLEQSLDLINLQYYIQTTCYNLDMYMYPPTPARHTEKKNQMTTNFCLGSGSFE